MPDSVWIAACNVLRLLWDVLCRKAAGQASKSSTKGKKRKLVIQSDLEVHVPKMYILTVLRTFLIEAKHAT
jgi:hypothetical protein